LFRNLCWLWKLLITIAALRFIKRFDFCFSFGFFSNIRFGFLASSSALSAGLRSNLAED
jgi:hypothetical protein